MKKLLLLLCFVVFAGTIRAQELKVKSFSLNPMDLTAKVKPRYDLNKEPGAVIRVAVASKDVTFSGNIIGEKECSKSGEYLVYVPAGTRLIKISVDGCLPLTYEFPMRPQSFHTYELQLLMPQIERTQTVIMPAYSIGSSSQSSFGLMVGFVRKNGAYLRLKSNMNFFRPDGASDDPALTGNRRPWYTGNDQKERWAATAGYMRRLAKPLYLYLGAGYGERTLAWESVDNGWIEQPERSYKGVEAEVGAIVKFGVFALSAGVQTNSFQYWEGNFGVGVIF